MDPIRREVASLESPRRLSAVTCYRTQSAVSCLPIGKKAEHPGQPVKEEATTDSRSKRAGAPRYLSMELEQAGLEGPESS